MCETPPQPKRAPRDSPLLKLETRKKRTFVMELQDAVRQGDDDEVQALLQLTYPDRPVVFQALTTGCVATVESVLARGADPNETLNGFSPLAACLIASARPLPLFRPDAPRIPAFAGASAVAVVRALLVAGATPTADDLRNACCFETAEIGKLLLAFRCPLLDGMGVYQPPLVLTACAHCPDLIYPLLERGAEMPGAVPPTINPEIFRDVYWNQVKMLYLLYHRSCFRVHKDLLTRIAAFLAEPIRVTYLEDRMDTGVLTLPPPRLADLLSPLQVC
jgi:hypothetical protein